MEDRSEIGDTGNLIQNPSSSLPHRAANRRTVPGWVWVVVVAALSIVVPILVCGTLGIGLSFASNGPQSPTGALGPAVGVIRVEGPIIPGRTDTFSGAAGSETVVDLIDQAADDSDIKAIVLRIDSPGGGVVASDEIYQALQRLEKPVVVSMGTVAASGGYFIAAPSDYIFATPYTITGSIGVISQFITAEELLDEVGVEVVVITSGEVKDFGSFHREMTDEERAYWQSLIDEIYQGFVQVVADGRGMDVERVSELANGQVFTGTQALELGLVDEIGYMDDAIDKAAELGEISGEPRVIELAPEVSLLDAFYGLQTIRQDSLTFELLRDMSTPVIEFRYIGP